MIVRRERDRTIMVTDLARMFEQVSRHVCAWREAAICETAHRTSSIVYVLLLSIDSDSTRIIRGQLDPNTGRMADL